MIQLMSVGIVCLFAGVYFGYWCGYREGLDDCIDDHDELHSTNKVERKDELIQIVKYFIEKAGVIMTREEELKFEIVNGRRNTIKKTFQNRLKYSKKISRDMLS